MIDKTELTHNQYSSQSKPSENNSFAKSTEENKFFINTFENQSSQKDPRSNASTFQTAIEENQEELLKELEKIKLMNSQNMSNSQNTNPQIIANYYLNSKGPNNFNDNSMMNNNFYMNQNMNMGYNNNFNTNYTNVNRNIYNNNMNFMNSNAPFQGNINNRNQYQFNQYSNNSYMPHHSNKKGYNSQQNQYQVDESSIIQSLKFVAEKYPHLINLNTNNIGMTNQVKSQVFPRFYVIKSFTEEDIHKSIKYNCWSSTREGNKKLSYNYVETKKKNSEVYLFFSMNGSGRFVGVCKMNSEVDENVIFEFWAMDDVWKGLFQVEWIFIKDIPNKFFKDIKLSNNGFKSVTNSRDTQEIPRLEGEMMLKIFEDFKFQTCILQHFQYYDERQSLFENTKNNS